MSSKTDFLPSRDADLVLWSASFRTQIEESYELLGLSEAQVSEYAQLDAQLASTYAAASSSSTRTSPAIQAKNTARRELKAFARRLAAIIRAHPGTTAAQRSQLGLTASAEGSSQVPVDRLHPKMIVVSSVGRRVRVRLRDIEHPTGRGKPDGVVAATVLAFVGEKPPEDILDWSFVKITTRTIFHIDLPVRATPGSRVWMCAFWFTAKAESGPASQAVSVRVNDGIGTLAA